MSKETYSRIVTQETVETHRLKDIVHFYQEEGRLDIPLPFDGIEMEEIRGEFGAYDSIEEMFDDKKRLKKSTTALLDTIQLLGIKSFLLEHLDDMDWATVEFMQWVVKEGQIVKESTQSNTNEDADLYSYLYLGFDYTDCSYSNYDQACRLFHKQRSQK